MLNESIQYEITLQLFVDMKLQAYSMSNAEWNQLECIWHFLGSFENSIKLIFWNPLSNNLFCTLLFNRNK